MGKGRVNNNNYLRYGLVVFIILAFLGSIYFIVKSPTTGDCAVQGKAENPKPGQENKCIARCKPTLNNWWCKTDNCKPRWDENKKSVVCRDCEIGNIAVQNKNTGDYTCQQACGSNEDCPTNQKCIPVSTERHTSPPSYCGTALYSCVLDPPEDIKVDGKTVVSQGERGKKCVPDPAGSPLNECLLRGAQFLNSPSDSVECACNHKKGYALNSENTACDTLACTEDGLNGWGSEKNKSIKSTGFKPKVDTDKGTCYSLDTDGLLVNPKNDKTACSTAKNKIDCINNNSDGWKCKWLPEVSCDRTPKPPEFSCDQTGYRNPDNPITPNECNGMYEENLWSKHCTYEQINSICCGVDQPQKKNSDHCNYINYSNLEGVSDKATYFIPNCLDTEGATPKTPGCATFFKQNGSKKTKNEIGGYNPVTEYRGICWLDPYKVAQYGKLEEPGFHQGAVCSRTQKQCGYDNLSKPC